MLEGLCNNSVLFIELVLNNVKGLTLQTLLKIYKVAYIYHKSYGI